MYLVCGEVLLDLLGKHQPLRSADPMQFQAMMGGSPFNVAVGLARLGCPVAFGSDVARDRFGTSLIARLRGEAIDERFLHRSLTHTPLALVSLGSAGSPSYSFYGLAEGAFAPSIGSGAVLSDVRALHLGSISLVLRRSEQVLLALAEKLATRAFVSLDPNVRLSVEPDRQRWIRAIARLRPYVQLIKISAEDIVELYGEDTDPDALCRSWLSGRTRLVVLTRGADGASFYAAGQGRIDIAPFPIELADTVGAGDSFMAALLARLGPSGDAGIDWGPELLRDAGRYAAAAAALTCSASGPSFPRRSDVEQLLRGEALDNLAQEAEKS